MKIQLKEFLDMVACTEICCYTDEQTQLAKETFIGVGMLNEPIQLNRCIKIALEHAGILFGNDLDTVARRFNSSADLVSSGTYRIVDLLNYSMVDFKNGTAYTMYFKEIPNTGVRGGLYRQLSNDEIPG